MMSTAESVKAQLTALIGRANEATGKADADMTAAVASLIDEIGAGGGGYELVTGSVTFAEATNKLRVTGLKRTPIATCVWPDIPSSEFIIGESAQIGHVWFNGLWGLFRTNNPGTTVTVNSLEAFKYGDFTLYEDDYSDEVSGVFALKTGFIQIRDGNSYQFRVGVKYNWAAIV